MKGWIVTLQPLLTLILVPLIMSKLKGWVGLDQNKKYIPLVSAILGGLSDVVFAVAGVSAAGGPTASGAGTGALMGLAGVGLRELVDQWRQWAGGAGQSAGTSQVVKTLLAAVGIAAVTVACATTPLGKAVQAADAQKRVVEASAVEVVKLHLTGQLSDADYTRAKDAYAKWAAGETTLAQSLAAWKSVQAASTSDRLSAALQSVFALSKTYFEFVGQFVDLSQFGYKPAPAAKTGG